MALNPFRFLSILVNKSKQLRKYSQNYNRKCLLNRIPLNSTRSYTRGESTPGHSLLQINDVTRHSNLPSRPTVGRCRPRFKFGMRVVMTDCSLVISGINITGETEYGNESGRAKINLEHFPVQCRSKIPTNLCLRTEGLIQVLT